METLLYYKPGTWVYTLIDDVMRVIINHITISIYVDKAPEINYYCYSNEDQTGCAITRTHDKIFATKEDLIKSL